jgi:hypothetical protein
MSSSVLIIGIGDMARQIGHWLADSPLVDELVLASRNVERGETLANLLAACHACRVRFVKLDGTVQADVERLIEQVEPQLILQNATLIGPWALVERGDEKSKTLFSVGLGPQLPAQLPVIMAVMRAAQATGYDGPVANLSLPDITNPVLGKLGLAPTVGLGNAGMVQFKVRAALLAGNNEPVDKLPLIRVVAHHSQTGISMTSKLPSEPDERCRVYLGEEGRRADELAYSGPSIGRGIMNNISTTASTVPVLLSVLPGGPDLRASMPGFQGLPGGYPLRIEQGRVSLDLPPGVELDEAIRFNEVLARDDGIESIGEDGTVTFTAKVAEVMADFDPVLAEPLHPDDIWPRYERLCKVLEV